MKRKEYNDFLVKSKDNELFKVSHKENIGIYYETIVNNKIINKDILYKNSLKYFYILEDNNRDINFIYQDMFGNVKLDVFIEDTIRHKDFFYGNKNYITPLKFKGVYLKKDIMLLYKIDIDNKIYLYNNNNKNSNVIYHNQCDTYIDYRIVHDKNFISLIIYSVTVNIFKLVLKTYNIKNKSWSSNKVIFIAEKPYIDMSFCISNSRVHSLIIVNENEKMKLIYKHNNLNKESFIERELTIYEDNDISSCLVIEVNNIIWLFWVSKNQMYYCNSIDFGENFSKGSICLKNIDDSIRKIDFIDNGMNKEIYISEKDENFILILDELINHKDYLNINYKGIIYNDKDKKEVDFNNYKIKSN